jgi:hypothetical protein
MVEDAEMDRAGSTDDCIRADGGVVVPVSLVALGALCPFSYVSAT